MFTKVQLENLIYGYCNSLHCKGVKALLDEYHDNIDIVFNEGLLFQIAIHRESVDLLNILLNFYAKTRLQGNPESLEYKFAYKKLQSMLEEASEANDVAPAIGAIIAPYLPKDEESEDEQDLSDFEDVIGVTNHSVIMHKSHSESDLTQHQQVVGSKLLLHSSSESLLSELDSSGSTDVHETTNLGQGSGLNLAEL